MSLKEKIADLRKHLQSGDENVKAFGSGFLFISLMIIGVIALALDIIFVVMIWNALPAGFLRYFAGAGAVLISPVVMLVLLAKLFYFRKGGQLIFSFIVFGIDIAFATLNTYVAFQLAWHDTNAFTVGWRNLSPITPVAIMVLLAILVMLDPNAARRNKQRDYQEKERDLELQANYEDKERQFALRQLDLELKAAQEEAAIEVKSTALDEYKKLLKEEILSDESLAELREAARRLSQETLHALTGLPRRTVSEAVRPPALRLVPSAQQSAPVTSSVSGQPFSQDEALEQMYKRDPEGFATIVEAIRQRAAQTTSPLAMPPLTQQASQVSGNGNGHAKTDTQ